MSDDLTITPLTTESIWDSGATSWDSGASRWDYTAPIVLALAASLTATSQGRATPPGIHVNLAGQITAGSRATAYLPRALSLAARLTSVSSARLFYAPPPNRVLAGRSGATSSAAAHATITSISAPRQTEVSIIT